MTGGGGCWLYKHEGLRLGPQGSQDSCEEVGKSQSSSELMSQTG